MEKKAYNSGISLAGSGAGLYLKRDYTVLSSVVRDRYLKLENESTDKEQLQPFLEEFIYRPESVQLEILELLRSFSSLD
ncbi:MAG: hypothetical protein ACTSWN_01785 [Promethearchaeota archaeon]